jgi:hypothetical protein
MLLCTGPRPVPDSQAAEPGTSHRPHLLPSHVPKHSRTSSVLAAERRLGISITPIPSRLAQVGGSTDLRTKVHTRTGCDRVLVLGRTAAGEAHGTGLGSQSLQIQSVGKSETGRTAHRFRSGQISATAADDSAEPQREGMRRRGECELTGSDAARICTSSIVVVTVSLCGIV